MTKLAFTQDWLTVFTANAQHLGRIEGEIARRIIRSYAFLKALIEEFRINNTLIDRYETIQAEKQYGVPHAVIEQSLAGLKTRIVTQTRNLKQVEASLFREVDQLFTLLDEHGIK